MSPTSFFPLYPRVTVMGLIIMRVYFLRKVETPDSIVIILLILTGFVIMAFDCIRAAGLRFSKVLDLEFFLSRMLTNSVCPQLFFLFFSDATWFETSAVADIIIFRTVSSAQKVNSIGITYTFFRCLTSDVHLPIIGSDVSAGADPGFLKGRGPLGARGHAPPENF